MQCITLVILYGQFMMHGQRNIKLCDAKQVYHYKNIKLKLYKNNAAIWFNKTCKAKHLTPTYASIKIKGDNSRCQKIQCITLVILYGQFMMHGQRNIKLST